MYKLLKGKGSVVPAPYRHQSQPVPKDTSARNDGWKYETQVMTLLSSHWSKESAVKDFRLLTSPLGVKVFNHIVAVLIDDYGTKYAFMGQVKCSEQKMNLKFNNKKKPKNQQKNGAKREPETDIRLDSFLNSYRNITAGEGMKDDLKDLLNGIPQKNYYYFLFTPMKATDELVEIPVEENYPLKYLKVKSGGCFRWGQNAPSGYEHFFQNLYFLTGQDNTTDINKALQESLSGDTFTYPMIDTLYEFIDNYMTNDKYCAPLTKSTFLDKCIEVRLSENMRVGPIGIGLEEEYLPLWDEIFSKYTTVKIDDTILIMSLIYSYFEFKIKTSYGIVFNWNDCIKNNQKIETLTRGKKRFHNLVDLLRFMASRKEIPWIIKEEHEQLVKEFKDRGSSGRFLITYDASDKTESFYNAYDLKTNQPNIFIKIYQTIEVSLQGRCSCPLKEIVGDSDDILKAIDTVRLLRWSSSNKHNTTIGTKLEEPNEHYIARTFSNDKKILTEEQVIATVKPGNLTAISNNIGMGKSITLKSLAFKADPVNYVLFWNLGESLEDFDSENPELYNDPLGYIFHKSETDGDQLIKAIFQNHLVLHRVIVFIDSYDETVPLYEEKMLDVIEVILKRNVGVVVTTRCHAESLLRKRFPDVTVFSLTQLDERDVDNYCKTFNIPRDLQSSLPNDFLKVPLRLSMIKQIKNITLNSLIEYLIDQKISRYFCKNRIPNNRREIRLKKILRTHKQIAMLSLFKGERKNRIITDDKWDEIVDTRKDIETIGIVSSLDSNQIQFTHQIYAEYLSARWMFENKRHAINFFEITLQGSYHQTLKLLVEINVAAYTNVWNLSRNILKRDEWELLPLHWVAMHFFFDEKKVDIFKSLFLRTVELVPDANDFIKQHIPGPDLLSSRLWLKCAQDTESDECLHEKFHLNFDMEIKYYQD